MIRWVEGQPGILRRGRRLGLGWSGTLGMATLQPLAFAPRSSGVKSVLKSGPTAVGHVARNRQWTKLACRLGFRLPTGPSWFH